MIAAIIIYDSVVFELMDHPLMGLRGNQPVHQFPPKRFFSLTLGGREQDNP